MTYNEKIIFLYEILSVPEASYADSFKGDIIMYFNDDFTIDNQQLIFLKKIDSEEKIILWVETLLSRFVMKFDSENETENDFIFDYLENG